MSKFSCKLSLKFVKHFSLNKFATKFDTFVRAVYAVDVYAHEWTNAGLPFLHTWIASRTIKFINRNRAERFDYKDFNVH